MLAFVERKVSFAEITVQGTWYYHPKLLRYSGTNVLVRPKGGRLEVSDCHGNFICTAKEVIFSEETAATE